VLTEQSKGHLQRKQQQKKKKKKKFIGKQNKKVNFII
jgi:hypothetical protein